VVIYFVRQLKRLIVLVPGLVIAYVAVYDIYPVIDRRVPAVLAILTTYILAAYVLVPTLLRLIGLVFKPQHIPLYCTTPDGFACDPINIGIIGTQEELVTAMTKAGWYQADKRTLYTVFKLGMSMVLKRPYHTAPFSSLYLFGRSQDIGFELPLDNNPRHRHHVRFWAASHTGDPRHLDYISFWDRFHKSNLLTGKVLWVGAASLDTGLGVIRHNAQLTHMIHYDTNAERELITKGLKKAGLVKKVRNVSIGKPYRLTNRVISGYMHADGKMKICELKG
jgi:hypothetical protein